MFRLTGLALMVLAIPLTRGEAQALVPWYARDRWQLELSNGAVIFECQLRDRRGDTLFVAESDTVRAVALPALTGLRLLRPAAKTVAHGARGTFGALAGADDEVFQLTLLTLPERRAVVDTLLRQHRPSS